MVHIFAIYLTTIDSDCTPVIDFLQPPEVSNDEVGL